MVDIIKRKKRKANVPATYGRGGGGGGGDSVLHDAHDCFLLEGQKMDSFVPHGAIKSTL